MQCHEFHTLLRSQQPLSEEAERHLDTCEACQELVEHELMLATMLQSIEEEEVVAPTQQGEVLDDLFLELELDIVQSEQGFGFLKSLPFWQRSGLVGLAGAILIVLVYFFLPKPNMGSTSFVELLLSVLSLFVVLSVGSHLVLRPLYLAPTSPLQRGVHIGLAALLPVTLALLPYAHAHPLPGANLAAPMFWSKIVACSTFGVLTTLPFLGLLWLANSTEQPRRHSLLTLGLTGGLFGNIMVMLHCPAVHPAHLLFGHAMVLPLAVLLGTLLIWWLVPKFRKAPQT